MAISRPKTGSCKTYRLGTYILLKMVGLTWFSSRLNFPHPLRIVLSSVLQYKQAEQYAPGKVDKIF